MSPEVREDPPGCWKVFFDGVHCGDVFRSGRSDWIARDLDHACLGWYDRFDDAVAAVAARKR